MIRSCQCIISPRSKGLSPSIVLLTSQVGTQRVISSTCSTRLYHASLVSKSSARGRYWYRYNSYRYGSNQRIDCASVIVSKVWPVLPFAAAALVAQLALERSEVHADSTEILPLKPQHLSSPKKNQVEKKRFGSVEDLRRRYRLGRVLGEGTFAVVRIGYDRKSGARVAVKEIRKDQSDEAALENEVNIMKMTGCHDNIISLIEIFDSDDTLYLVMDLAEGGELFDRIIEQGELSEKAASCMIKEALLATKHLHERHIVHLDIKPENLLLTTKDDRGHIKLADFGLAISIPDKHKGNIKVSEFVGTPAYWAPELVRNEPFGSPADIWALGCVLYIMLCGSHPFDPYGDDPEAQILARVASGKYDQDNKQYSQISNLAKDLIRHMLDPCPSKRYTAQQTLEHPWVSHAEQLSDEPLPSSNIEKLKGFRAIQLLRAGMENMLNDPRACEAMFNSFDTDGDGYLTRHEFSRAFTSLGLQISERELDELLEALDENNDGKISRTEFDAVMNKQLAMPDKFAKASLDEIQLLFSIFDRDQDGYIAKKDFKHVLGLIGSVASESVVFQHAFMSEKSSNCLVDFKEFAYFYRKLEEERMQQGILRGASIHIKKKRTIGR